MTDTFTRRDLERRLRSTFRGKADQVAVRDVIFDAEVSIAMGADQKRPRKSGRRSSVTRAWIAAAVVVVIAASAAVAFRSDGNERTSQVAAGSHRMVPSDRTVLPGQVITLTLHGAGTRNWGGGVDSYFEARTTHGWQRLYMLYWHDGAPSVRAVSGAVDQPLVRATPFPALIPAVEPGVYRITRRFLIAPGIKTKQVTLSALVTVRKCPNGQSPSFVSDSSSTTAPGTLGVPQCAAPAR